MALLKGFIFGAVGFILGIIGLALTAVGIIVWIIVFAVAASQSSM